MPASNIRILMDTITEQFSIEGEAGELIRCDISYRNGRQRQSPVAIFCHGFKGFKDWGGWPYFRTKLAEAGSTVIGVNFSHNGIGEDPESFTRLDLFKEDTLSGQSRDLVRVIEALKCSKIPQLRFEECGPVVLIGHSRGGVPVISAAASQTGIAGLVLLAAIADLPEVGAEDEAKWRNAGYWLSQNYRTQQQMLLGIGLLEELVSKRDMISSSAELVKVPALIIQGDEDSSVPVAAAGKLNRWIKGSEMLILSGADHNFGTKHPFAGSTEDFERVIAEVAKFIGRI